MRRNRKVALMWNMKMTAATVLISLLGLLMVGCDRQSGDRKEVRLSAESEGEARQASVPRVVPVRIAVAPVISPRESVGLYGPLLQHISSRLGRPVDFLQRSTYGEVNDLLRYGRAEAAFVCDYAFVEGERDSIMEIIAVPVVMGKEKYQSYIIVPVASKARDIFDLKDKRFAFSDPLSSSGWLFPSHLLREAGKRPETFFRRCEQTGSHDNTVEAVAKGLVDGGAVDSLVYEYMLIKDPVYGRKTKKIQESPLWGNPPVVVHPRIDSTLREDLKRVFLTIHESEQGRKLLEPLKIDRFIPPDDASYDPVRQMAEKARKDLITGTAHQPAKDSDGDQPGH